jgi:hypothetical protein
MNLVIEQAAVLRESFQTVNGIILEWEITNNLATASFSKKMTKTLT